MEYFPTVTHGYVIKVYDGDTFTIATRMPIESPTTYRFSVRLRGIDAPELRGGTGGEEEHQAALHSQRELEKLILHRVVELRNIGRDKYGRLLADVIYRSESVSSFMLQRKLALPYDGGTKSKFISASAGTGAAAAAAAKK